MHGDFFTKPLQGTLFRSHRAMILGLPSAVGIGKMADEAKEDAMDTMPQERVEPYMLEDKDMDK